MVSQNLTEESLDPAFEKLKKHRKDYIDLDNKSEENVKAIVDYRFKPLLTLPEESYDLIKSILTK